MNILANSFFIALVHNFSSKFLNNSFAKTIISTLFEKSAIISSNSRIIFFVFKLEKDNGLTPLTTSVIVQKMVVKSNTLNKFFQGSGLRASNVKADTMIFTCFSTFALVVFTALQYIFS